MTKDEILNMESGREMDALVAEKVMGWYYQEDWGCLIPPDLKVGPHEMFTDWELDEETLDYVRKPIKNNFPSGIAFNGLATKVILPEFSTDIKDAWKVVERMRGQSVAMTVSTMGPRERTSAFYIVNSKGSPMVWANTPSLAICRAALLATLEE